MVGDCQAVGMFADFAAAISSNFGRQGHNVGAFIDAFAELTPSDGMHGLAGIADLIGIRSVPGDVNLNPGTLPSTFLPQFQDSGRDKRGGGGKNADQSQHFAFYFQLGYHIGALEAEIVGTLQDLRNPGDVRLATTAARIGYQLKTSGNVADAVSEIKGLCNN